MLFTPNLEEEVFILNDLMSARSAFDFKAWSNNFSMSGVQKNTILGVLYSAYRPHSQRQSCQCVSVSMCHLEDEKTRDTKTSGR